MRRHVLAALVAVALALGGCSGGDSVDTSTDDSAPTGEQSTTTEPAATGGEGAVDYLEALASYSPTEAEQMLDLAEPGTFAHDYATHQVATIRALADSGLTTGLEGAVTVSASGDEIEVCDPENECNDYGDFETDPDSDLLTDFTIDGNDLDDRLVLGDGAAVSQAGIDYTLISAYVAATSGALFVALDVTNNTDFPFDPSVYSATYVGADGRQISAADGAGPTTLQPGATATVVGIFDGADLGGAVQLEGFLDDPNFTITNHEIPVPAP